MMAAAAKAASETAARLGKPRPLVIAVTVLTSLDDRSFARSASNRPFSITSSHLARLAQDSGLDGVVASPQEIAAIRRPAGRTS